MLTDADMGGGGVKNGQKSADVLYGRSLGVVCWNSIPSLFLFKVLFT